MQIEQFDIIQVAALVAAYVGVIKAFGIPSKFNAVIAILIATLFVLVPTNIEKIIETISIIALTASGAYHYTKIQSVDSQIKMPEKVISAPDPVPPVPADPVPVPTYQPPTQ